MKPSDSWARLRVTSPHDSPFLFTVVYGVVDVPTVSQSKYGTRGIPEGVDARVFSRADNAAYLSGFEEGHAWEALAASNSDLARAISASPGAIVLAGEVADATTLQYLRDSLGIIAALLDHGGVAVYDPLTFRWWSASEWKEQFFERGDPDPRRHVMIYYSEEPDGFWLHTRGLLVFGRPDLSIRGVSREAFDDAAGMCNELIEHLAFGGVVNDGQKIRHPRLGAFTACAAGDRDDPEFNNRHIELIQCDESSAGSN